MNNIIILGSGRSGTSLLTGMLAQSGFHLGDNYDYLNKNNANPKGYFEDYEVNTVNEDILDKTIFGMPIFLKKILTPRATFYRARWLATIPVRKKINTKETINERISDLIKKNPFCYKDPRFSYTLPVWKPLIEQNNIKIKYLVVYRDPRKTANSILRECQESSALGSLKMDVKRALKVWQLMYEHILKNYEQDDNKKNWMFVHFDQLFDSQKINGLETFVGVEIDNQFPEKELSRAQLDGEKISHKVNLLYKQLNELSAYL